MALSQNEKDEYGQNNEKNEQTKDGQLQAPRGTTRRPQLEPRGYTETGAAGKESPKLLAADQSDHVDRVSLPSVYQSTIANPTTAPPKITQ